MSKKTIGVSTIFLIVILLLPLFSFAQTDSNSLYSLDIEQIENYQTDIVVNYDASIDVTETIVYNFGQNEKHGIYRDVPIIYTTKSGEYISLDLQNISVTDESGQPYTFIDLITGNNRRIKIGDPDKFITGVHTYIINYNVPHAVGFFDTFDEIYWNVIGTQWAVPIIEASANVYLPKSFTKSELNRIACYYGSTGSNVPCDWARVDDNIGIASGKFNSIAFSVPTKLNAYEGLTVAVGFPTGVVSGSATSSSLSVTTTPITNNRWLWFIIPVIIFILMFWRWNKYGKDPKGTGVIIPQYNSPDGLSPMQISFVLKQSFGNSLSAEIVYLATKGFLKIYRITTKGIFSSADDYEFEKLKNSDSTLQPFQQKLLDGLFATVVDNLLNVTNTLKSISTLENDSNSSNSVRLAAKLVDKLTPLVASDKHELMVERLVKNKVRLSDLKYRFYATVQQVGQDCQSSLIDAGYYPEGKKGKSMTGIINSRGITRIIGIIILGFFGWFFLTPVISVIFGGLAALACFLSIIIIIIFQILMPQMTEKGVLTKEYIKGFKLYLSVAEKDRLKFHNAPMKNPESFEKLLPYAMTLGVEKEWAKVFEGIELPPISWYDDSSMTTFNATTFATSMSSFSTISSLSLSSAPGSSSGSGGGGSSGGGGGGGGGGSW